MGEYPEIGAFEFYTGGYNYLKAEYLVGVVIERLQRQLARMTTLQVSLEGEPAAEEIVKEAVRLKESHLERLEGFRATRANREDPA